MWLIGYVRNALFPKTVDSVLYAFRGAVADLKEVVANTELEVAEYQNKIVELNDDIEIGQVEINRAKRILFKLDELFK